MLRHPWFFSHRQACLTGSGCEVLRRYPQAGVVSQMSAFNVEATSPYQQQFGHGIVDSPHFCAPSSLCCWWRLRRSKRCCCAAVGFILFWGSLLLCAVLLFLFATAESPEVAIPSDAVHILGLSPDYLHSRLNVDIALDLKMHNPNWFGGTVTNVSADIRYVDLHHDASRAYLAHAVNDNRFDLKPLGNTVVPCTVQVCVCVCV